MAKKQSASLDKTIEILEEAEVHLARAYGLIAVAKQREERSKSGCDDLIFQVETKLGGTQYGLHSLLHCLESLRKRESVANDESVPPSQA